MAARESWMAGIEPAGPGSPDDFDMLHDFGLVLGMDWDSDSTDEFSFFMNHPGQEKRASGGRVRTEPTTVPKIASGRLAGPHEVPFLPYIPSPELDGGVAAVTQHLDKDFIHDDVASASGTGIHPSPASAEEEGVQAPLKDQIDVMELDQERPNLGGLDSVCQEREEEPRQQPVSTLGDHEMHLMQMQQLRQHQQLHQLQLQKNLQRLFQIQRQQNIEQLVMPRQKKGKDDSDLDNLNDDDDDNNDNHNNNNNNDGSTQKPLGEGPGGSAAQPGTAAPSRQGNIVNDGLKYTKSVDKKKLRNKDALIAVMGMAGSGKTTFISKVTGRNDLRIGHGLTSCTQDIEAVETTINGQTVRFVDTPGFSNTNMSDTEVLQKIADYLAAAYKREMKLSGIIYMHPISDTCVTHHTTKNLDMLAKLTGEKNLKSVVLATSMWDKVTDPEGLDRQKELETKFWKPLTAMGAKTVLLDDTAESARRTALTLLCNKPFYVQLQEEMGKDNKALRDTAAGREVMGELARIKEEHQRELAKKDGVISHIRSSAKESEGVTVALRELCQSTLEELEGTLEDERRVNEAAVESLKHRVEALEERCLRWRVMLTHVVDEVMETEG